MNGLAAKDSRFVRKLYLILAQEDVALVRWTADGRAFTIVDTAGFQRAIKSKHHLSSLCTFRQNLRAHAFVELANGDASAMAAGVGVGSSGRCDLLGRPPLSAGEEDAPPPPETYYHPFFVRGRPELLERIEFDARMKYRCQECKRHPSENGAKCSFRRREERAFGPSSSLSSPLSSLSSVLASESTPSSAPVPAGTEGAATASARPPTPVSLPVPPATSAAVGVPLATAVAGSAVASAEALLIGASRGGRATTTASGGGGDADRGTELVGSTTVSQAQPAATRATKGTKRANPTAGKAKAAKATKTTQRATAKTATISASAVATAAGESGSLVVKIAPPPRASAPVASTTSAPLQSEEQDRYRCRERTLAWTSARTGECDTATVGREEPSSAVTSLVRRSTAASSDAPPTVSA
ncbi:hypothetical protein PybrP1_000893 [[Pythium] brassicae (nom. inval.)]|nr:hypothetical protein PybrP1_000893 [[Pythium] brassicae (nom. inval.)]